jgi:hypothetical protein
MEEYTAGMTFGHARRNFYEAARHGLAAELLWPGTEAPSPRGVVAKELILQLLPIAREGLVRGGVDATEAEAWLADIQGRVTTGVTGAVWQLQRYDQALASCRPADALRAMLAHYLDRSETDTPVHQWDAS